MRTNHNCRRGTCGR